jgi:C-terminal processing protease CtpA/Prc
MGTSVASHDDNDGGSNVAMRCTTSMGPTVVGFSHPRLWRRLAIRLVVPCAFALGALTGVVGVVGNLAFAADVDGTYEKLRIFSQVLAYVQQNYVDDVNEEDLVYDAVTGMLKDLDPHTTFMRPEEYQKLREDTAGEFGGLGIDVGPLEGGIEILGVVLDGPAHRAGITVGDIVLAVDGVLIPLMERSKRVSRCCAVCREPR